MLQFCLKIFEVKQLSTQSLSNESREFGPSESGTCTLVLMYIQTSQMPNL